MRQVGFADPAQHHVLLDGRAGGFLDETPADISQRPQLVRGDIAQRQGDSGDDITFLSLLVNIGAVPLGKAFARFGAVEGLARFELFLVGDR